MDKQQKSALALDNIRQVLAAVEGAARRDGSIATILGLEPRVVSGALQDLRRAGLIVRAGSPAIWTSADKKAA